MQEDEFTKEKKSVNFFENPNNIIKVLNRYIFSSKYNLTDPQESDFLFGYQISNEELNLQKEVSNEDWKRQNYVRNKNFKS